MLGKVWFFKVLFKNLLHFVTGELLGLGGWNPVEGFVCAGGAPWLWQQTSVRAEPSPASKSA